MNEILMIVIGFLSGGTAGVIVNHFFLQRSARIERQISQLNDQLRELYAPLFYLVLQAEKLLEINKRIRNADKVASDQKYSDNPLTQERLQEQTDQTLGLANDYVKFLEQKIEQISVLLDEKFAYIDPDDVELFLLFFEHRTRLNMEKREDGTLRTPTRIYRQLGDISYIHIEFIGRVKWQFRHKKDEVHKLSSNRRWWTP